MDKYKQYQQRTSKMPRFFVSKTLQSLICLFVVVHHVDSAPMIIDSGTIATAIGSPTLGAGYTITNNAFYSPCLDFNDSNIVMPESYNHECEFIHPIVYPLSIFTNLFKSPSTL